jgi:hypothetical protein
MQFLTLLSNGLCFHKVCVLYLVIIYRDHWEDNERPAWLRLKGLRRFNSDAGRKYLASTGIQFDWSEYLNYMVDLPENEAHVQDEIELPKKRGRKRKASEEDSTPAPKKPITKMWP